MKPFYSRQLMHAAFQEFWCLDQVFTGIFHIFFCLKKNIQENMILGYKGKQDFSSMQNSKTAHDHTA
jgi:hypothetical protein